MEIFMRKMLHASKNIQIFNLSSTSRVRLLHEVERNIFLEFGSTADSVQLKLGNGDTPSWRT